MELMNLSYKREIDRKAHFSMLSFSLKMTTGVGTFVAGLLLAWIDFPKQSATGKVAQSAIDSLGWIGGPLTLGFFGKGRFLEIRAGLKGKGRLSDIIHLIILNLFWNIHYDKS